MTSRQWMLAVAAAACAAVLGCTSGQDAVGENGAVSTDDAATESSDTLSGPATAAEAATVAPDTMPELTFPAPEATPAAWDTLMNRHTYWQTITGLPGPADLQVWNERAALACDAPIWEPVSGERLAAAFVHDDGGDAGDADLVESARWALLFMANDPSGCPHRFPRVATHPITWLNSTGLFGPLDVAVWQERLRPFCGISTRDAVAAQYKELAESTAGEYIAEDGGDPHEPGRLNSAADMLWIMSRTPGTCPEGSKAGTGHEGGR